LLGRFNRNSLFDKNKKEKKQNPRKKENDYGDTHIPYLETPRYDFSKSDGECTHLILLHIFAEGARNFEEKKRNPQKTRKGLLATPPFRIGKRPSMNFQNQMESVPMYFPPYFLERR